MFQYPYYKLIQKYFLQYLQAWIAKFHTMILRQKLDRKRAQEHASPMHSNKSDTSSISTFDTLDRQEYEIEEDEALFRVGCSSRQ